MIMIKKLSQIKIISYLIVLSLLSSTAIMASPINLRVWMKNPEDENRALDIKDKTLLKDPPVEIKAWAQKQRKQKRKIICIYSSKLTADGQAMIEEFSQKDGYAVMVVETSGDLTYQEKKKESLPPQ